MWILLFLHLRGLLEDLPIRAELSWRIDFLSFYVPFGLIRLINPRLESRDLGIDDGGGFLLLFRLDEGCNIEDLSFVFVESTNRDIDFLMSCPPASAEGAGGPSYSLGGNLLWLSFLTDSPLPHHYLNPIPHFLFNLVSDFSLVLALSDHLLLLFEPVEGLIQDRDHILFGEDVGQVAHHRVEALEDHDLEGVSNLLLCDSLVIVVELVDEEVELLLILEEGVGGELDVEGHDVHVTIEDALGVVLLQGAAAGSLGRFLQH